MTTSAYTPPTPTEVKAVREQRGCGLVEARHILIKERLLESLAGAPDPETIRDVLRVIVEKTFP